VPHNAKTTLAKDDQALLLGIEAVIVEDGIKLNWTAVAKHVSSTVSGEAVKQHLAKIRRLRTGSHLYVPPRKIGGSRKKKAQAQDVIDISSPPQTPTRVQDGSPAPPKVNKRKRSSGRAVVEADASNKAVKIENDVVPASAAGKKSNTGNGRKKGAPRQSNFILTEQYKIDFYAAAGKLPPSAEPRQLRAKPQKNYTEIVEEETQEVDEEKGDDVQKVDNAQDQYAQDASFANNVVDHTASSGNGVGYVQAGDNFGGHISLGGNGIDSGFAHDNSVGYGGNTLAPRFDSVMNFPGTGSMGENYDFSSGNNGVVASPGPNMAGSTNFNNPSPTSTRTTYGSFSSDGITQIGSQVGSFSNSPTSTLQNSQTGPAVVNSYTTPAHIADAFNSTQDFGGQFSIHQYNSDNAFQGNSTSFDVGQTFDGVAQYGNGGQTFGGGAQYGNGGGMSSAEMEQFMHF
jgi:hypothetical protein